MPWLFWCIFCLLQQSLEQDDSVAEISFSKKERKPDQVRELTLSILLVTNMSSIYMSTLYAWKLLLETQQ